MKSGNTYAEDVSSDEKPNFDGQYDPERDTELLHTLQDTVQNPPPGLIRYEDLRWIPHSTTGDELVIHSEIAAILRSRLDDFVEGQKQNTQTPANFNRVVKKKNPPGSLSFRYHCCFGPEDHSIIVPKNIEAVLDSTIKKRKQCHAPDEGKRRGKKVVPEYDVFTTTKNTKRNASRIGKKQIGRSIK